MSCAVQTFAFWQWFYIGLMTVASGVVIYSTFRVWRSHRELRASHAALMREMENELKALKQAPQDFLERMIAIDAKRRIVH